MTYLRLRLPDDFPELLKEFVSGSLEPYLMDVHVMFGVTGPSIDPSAEPHLLGHSIALTLLTVISSVADTLYARKGTNRENFIGTLNAHYPWDRAPANGLSKEDSADLLYHEFRNPIAHRAGIQPADKRVKRVMGIYLPYPQSSDPYREIIELERSDKPPNDQTLNIDSATCFLELPTFYWGIRKMIEAIMADRGRWPDMVNWFQKHRFMPPQKRISP